jgi:hypothetical protein
MEWFIGFLGAIVGTATGGLSVFLTTRAQMQRQLVQTYDQDLRARRIDAYKGLYKLSGKMPRQWPGQQPSRSDMRDWPKAFDDWYFGDAGGLFLSDDARETYNAAVNTISKISTEGSADAELSEKEIERLWRAGQALRRTLAADIGAAQPPRLPGQKPWQTPPPTARFGIPGPDATAESAASS